MSDNPADATGAKLIVGGLLLKETCGKKSWEESGSTAPGTGTLI